MELIALAEAFRPFAKILLILSALVFAGICLDYLTGTIAAKMHKEWSSKVAREGIWHKVGIIIAILLAALLDVVVILVTRGAGITYKAGGLFVFLVSVCYILTEFGSILENLKKMGVYVPEILTRGFATFKHTFDAHADASIPPEPAEDSAGSDNESVPSIKPSDADKPPDERTEPPDEENM